MEGVLVPFIVFASITAIVIYIAFAKYRVRMEMIRKGPVNFLETPARTGSKTLLFGLFSVAIGLACFAAAFLNYFERHLFTVVLYWLFVGGALVVYWKVTAKDREQTCAWYEQILAVKTRNPGQQES